MNGGDVVAETVMSACLIDVDGWMDGSSFMIESESRV